MVSARGSKYQARVKEPRGKYHRYSFDTYLQADNWERQARSALSRGEPIMPPSKIDNEKSSILNFFDEHSEYVFGSGKSRTAFNRLTKSFPSLTIQDLQSLHLTKAVMAWKKEGLAPASINNYLSNIVSLYKHAVSLEVTHGELNVPWQSLNNSHSRDKVLHEEEEQLLFSKLDRMELYGYKYLFQFMIDTGCRVSEILEDTQADTLPITWDNVSVSAGGTLEDPYNVASKQKIAVVSIMDTKTGAKGKRTIPLTPRAAQALLWSKDSGHIRPFGITYRGASAVLKELRGNDKDLILYTFRHTCATRLTKRGAPLHRIQKFMGHQDIATTLKYAKLHNEDLYELADLL